MSDTKPTHDPMAEHIKRASVVLGVRLGAAKRPVDVEVLAEQFADVDAIARRRALEECAAICDHAADVARPYPEDHCEVHCAEVLAERIRALLRAPTDELLARIAKALEENAALGPGLRDVHLGHEAATLLPEAHAALKIAVDALQKIQQWDCLNPPEPELCADHPWLKRLVDQTLSRLTSAAKGRCFCVVVQHGRSPEERRVDPACPDHGAENGGTR